MINSTHFSETLKSYKVGIRPWAHKVGHDLATEQQQMLSIILALY